MSVTIKGNQLITWGAGQAGGVGKVQSASRKRGGDKVELLDENGEVFCVIYFNDKDECEFEAVFQSNITLPERGTAITIGGVVGCLVDDWEVKWQNNNAKMIVMRATKYANF